MKVTVSIPDAVYRRLKARAKCEGISTHALIFRGLEQVLKEKRAKSRRRVKLPLVPSKEPGTLQIDNAKIYEAISFP